MYYRLYDTQVGRYMATGYNTTSIKELADEYASYKSIDWNDGIEEGEETMEVKWARMSEDEKEAFIREDSFDIELSETKWDDSEWE